MTTRIVSFIVLVFAGCASTKPTDEQLASADYGEFPQHHRDIAVRWIEENIGRIEQSGIRDIVVQPPKKHYMRTGFMGGGEIMFGYLVELSFAQVSGSGRRVVTDRSRVELLVRNGEVVHYREERQ